MPWGIGKTRAECGESQPSPVRGARSADASTKASAARRRFSAGRFRRASPTDADRPNVCSARSFKPYPPGMSQTPRQARVSHKKTSLVLVIVAARTKSARSRPYRPPQGANAAQDVAGWRSLWEAPRFEHEGSGCDGLGKPATRDAQERPCGWYFLRRRPPKTSLLGGRTCPNALSKDSPSQTFNQLSKKNKLKQ